MTITNPTTTGAWSALTQHKASLTPNLRAWFEQDPSRAQKFSFDAADLHVDLSKNLITEETVQLLLKTRRRGEPRRTPRCYVHWRTH